MKDATLHIGIDGMVTPALRTGVGRYVEGLVQGLSEINEDCRISILLGSNQADFAQAMPMKFSVNISRTSTEQSLLNFLRIQFIVPLTVLYNDINVLHVPNEKLVLFKACPLVLTIHDIGDFRVARRTTLMRRLLRRITMPLVIRFADHIIAVSERTRQDLVEILHVDPNKISVIHEGVSEQILCKPSGKEIEDVLKRFGIGDDFVLFVGEISERKNIAVLLEAFRDVSEAMGRELRLVLAGKEGDSVDEIKRLVVAYKLSERVILTGHVSDRNLSVLYHSALCLVLPSKYEGFGLPVIEAMACGLPVLVSNTGSLPEVVMDAGLIVNCASAKPVSQALTKLLKDKELRIHLAAKGLERAKLFSWNNCALATLEVYKRALRPL